MSVTHPAASLGTSVPASDYYTPELLDKLGRCAANAAAFNGVDPEAIALALRAAGIGVVDLARTRHLVDELVYERALHRLRLAEERTEGRGTLLQRFLDCPEIADCAPEDKDIETSDLEREARGALIAPASASCASGTAQAPARVNALPPAGDADVA